MIYNDELQESSIDGNTDFSYPSMSNIGCFENIDRGSASQAFRIFSDLVGFSWDTHWIVYTQNIGNGMLERTLRFILSPVAIFRLPLRLAA